MNLQEWKFEQKAERTVPKKVNAKDVGKISAFAVITRAHALADAEGKRKGLKKEKGIYMTTDEHMNRAKAELKVDMAEDFDSETIHEELKVKIGDEYHPWNSVPMSKHDQFKKENPGSVVRFRGPRGRSEDGGHKAHTTKANATHFYVVTGPRAYHDSEIKESLAGESRGAEHDFAMNGGSDHSGGSSITKPSHAVKVGSTHFHPGKKGMGMAIQRAKALGTKPQIVKHPGGSLLGEAVEQSELVEGKLPDWAQAEFDSAFKKSPNKRKPDNDEHDVARFNPRIDGKYKVQSFAKGRVNTGSYGKSTIIDHEDEHPAAMPEKHPHTALDTSGVNNNPMVPKVKTSQAQVAAGPQRPKGKSATPEAMANYRKALRSHSMKKESFVYDGESFISLNELSMGVPIEEGLRPTWKNIERTSIGDTNWEQVKSTKTHTHYKHAQTGKVIRVDNKTGKNQELREEEVDNEIMLDVIKEGQMFNYTITFGDETIYEGVGSTISGVLAESNRQMASITESFIQKEGQFDRIKGIIKKYID